MSMIIAREIVPGTEWCTHDERAWWAPGERGTKPRAKVVDLLVGHWTAGEAGAKRYDDDGPFVVRGMKARRHPKTGELMRVAIHFVIGACDPDDEYAPVWQTADPGLTACIHAGKIVNARSVGVEVVSAGLPGKLDVRERPEVSVPLVGRVRRVLRFYPGQLRSWVRLANALAALDGQGGVRIPYRVPAFLGARRFSLREMREYRGALEHLHVPGATKLDAGGMLVDELARAGWAV